MSTHTYAQRQQIIKNILLVAKSKMVIHIEHPDRSDFESTYLQSLFNKRTRIAKDYYELVGFEPDKVNETLIDEFIHINEKIKLILGL
jgi:hypothetical protein